MTATPIVLAPPRLRAGRVRSCVSAPHAHTAPVPAFPHVAALRAARSRVRKHARARSRVRTVLAPVPHAERSLKKKRPSSFDVEYNKSTKKALARALFAHVRRRALRMIVSHPRTKNSKDTVHVE